jgi:protease IV
MNKSARLLIWISILGTLLFTVSLLAVFFIVGKGDENEGKPKALLVPIKGDIPDSPPQGAFVLDTRDMPPLLTELSAGIRKAASDEDVGSMVLQIEPVNLGWAGVQELASAIQVFHDSGKPCTATADVLTNKEYVLAATCGQIVLAPAGLFLVNGLSITQTYFLGALEKLGVTANLEHVGDYKSAVEPFERDSPSPAAQEATDSLLDSVYGQFIDAISQARGISRDDVEALVSEAPMSPEVAKADGLVDTLAHRRQIVDELAGPEPIRFHSYLDKVRKDADRKPFVAVIHAEGSIVSGASGQEITGGSFVGDRDLIRLLEEARKNSDVRAVVLRVNSPGGSGLASDNIWSEIERVREQMPVVVSMGDLAASGGYYISAGADAIVAEPGTLTGSIGVFGGKMNLRGLLEKLGVTLHTTKRGDLADIMSSTEDFSEKGRERIREYIGSFYTLFLDRVSAGRGMSTTDVDHVAKGRVWTGAQALENGLVDEVGGLDEAIARARAIAGVTEPTGILRLPEQKTFLDKLLEDIEKSPEKDNLSKEATLVPGVAEAAGDLLMLSRALGDGGVAALLPYDIDVH